VRRGAASAAGAAEDAALSDLAKTSKLPHSPNRTKIDAVCIGIVGDWV
jgi:hypothetical protein